MKIILSLESTKSLKLADEIKDYVDGFKVNHIMWNELPNFSRILVRAFQDKDLFIDFKLWDTPNTVKTVVEKILDKGATMTTICTLNSPEVFHTLKEFSDDIMLLGVSYLTSWRHKRQSWQEHAELTEPNGFKGMVCSAKDIPDIKSDLLKVCPGITFGSTNSGQVRMTTPREAQDLGADYIVIGRSVTASPNPIETLKIIKKSLDK